MIDSGSGITIISESLVRELKLKKQSDPDNIIVTASGENVKTNGRVEGLEIVMGDKRFTTDAIILPVNGYQILIGNDTLDPLEPCKAQRPQNINEGWKRKHASNIISNE